MLLGRCRFILVAFAFVALPVLAFAQDSSPTPGPSPSSYYLWDFTSPQGRPVTYMPYNFISGDLAAWPTEWSYYRREYHYGSNTLVVSGGADSVAGALFPGDPLYSGSVFGSVTYRFDGLFGGFVRPIARMTVGVSQYWSPLSPVAFQGLSTGAYAYATPEAGVEFVYEGYGVGVTASYPIPLGGFDQQGDIRGPSMFDPRHHHGNFDFSQVMKNFYLIVPPLISVNGGH